VEWWVKEPRLLYVAVVVSLRLVVDLALADGIGAEGASRRITLTAKLEVVVAARSTGRDGEVGRLVDITSLALVLLGEGLLSIVHIEDGRSRASARNSDNVHVLGSPGSRNCNVSSSSNATALVLSCGRGDAITGVNSSTVVKALISTLITTAPLSAPLHDDLTVSITALILDTLAEATLGIKSVVSITDIANHGGESTISKRTLGVMAVDLSTIALAKILGKTTIGTENVCAVAIRVISGLLVAVLGLIPAVGTGNTVKVQVPETGCNRRIGLRSSVENILPGGITRSHALLEISITEIDGSNTNIVQPGACCTLIVRSKVLLGRTVGNTILRPVLLSNLVLARNTSNGVGILIGNVEDGLRVAIEALLNRNSGNSNCRKNNKRLTEHFNTKK